MNTQEHNLVNNDQAAVQADVTQSLATSAQATIHWADTNSAVRPELERQFETMRARNWITDKMVQQYQKHWHCSREAALERLLAKTSD
jgi:hypothetical protein